ncbi:MAG: serine hydrolase [Candidatus Dormiibacterota bacterium]
MHGSTVDLQAAFRGVGARGWVHARQIDGDQEIGCGADDPVVLASVFKIPIVLRYAIEVDAGRLDPTERTTIAARHRTGGIGTGGCADDVTATWRDVALLMMTLSDNAATDAMLERVGLAAVNETLQVCGAERTRLVGSCADLFESVGAELGAPYVEALAAASPEQVRGLSVLDSARTSATTPRDITGLLAAIWRDEAGPAAACAEVRSIMARQIWPHRLSSGFPDPVKIAGKTGTLPSLRNEAGVVTYPDGGRYAVGVFTRADDLAQRQPAIDAAIGSAARMAVEALRV